MKNKMQVPNKINNKFNLNSSKIVGDNTITEVKITCCDTSMFECKTTGEIRHNLFLGTYLFSETGNIAIDLKCKKCSKELKLFDSTTDGYCNCIEEHKEIKDLQREEFKCKKCDSNDFSIYIKYEYPSIDELKELGIKEKDNAFTWIVITLKCNKCGKKYKKFIEFDAT